MMFISHDLKFYVLIVVSLLFLRRCGAGSQSITTPSGRPKSTWSYPNSQSRRQIFPCNTPSPIYIHRCHQSRTLHMQMLLFFTRSLLSLIPRIL